ncbi:Charged multivesicular body protein [Nesidiocoris tenuis]|uniref:Charged multivesicular body protein n=1 Tax=Nesidiocoris tenuis TaxID=355587 RepID=A0ABN7BBK8_9HEMI|nr:Charged multivesicular body protein [Nesidiocoris tenuis]
MDHPIQNLPSCWTNDQRMNCLFSPFRPKESNPIDYQSKLNFWSNLLDSWCSECGRATFTINGIRSAFRRKNVYPSCLETVVNELLKSGDVMRKDNFIAIDPEQSWSSWAVKSIIKTPAVWSFNKLKEALFEIDSSQIEYVNLKRIKTASSEILAKCEKEGKNLMTFEEFVAMADISEEETALILRWLVYKRKVSTIENSGSRLIKIGKETITEADITVKRLNHTINLLNCAVDNLEKQKHLLIEEAKSSLKMNMRDSAKRCLRKKKIIDQQIDRKVQAIQNLDGLLCRIHDAKTDAEVLDSYKVGIKALKNTLEENGLNVDSVMDTMAELEDVCEVQDEIGASLTKDTTPYEESELEDELISLLGQEIEMPKLPVASELEIPELPDVPVSDFPSEAQNSPNKNVPTAV